MHSSRKYWNSLALGLVVLWMLTLVGCAADFADSGYGMPAEGEWNNDAYSDYLVEAEAALINHNVKAAGAAYEKGLERDGRNGKAAAGKAVTDLLLVPGFSEVAALLIEDLGARHGLDANDVIYGRDGYLYWLSRGTSWEDQGQFEGIRSILSNRLPWPREKLESLMIFVDGLINSVDNLMNNLIFVAHALEEIEETFQIAIESPSFDRLYIPGQTFHDDQLSLVLGRSEISALQSALALMRGTILLLASYEHDWTLERAFGSWRHEVSPESDRFIEGHLAEDYTTTYLDDQLFRVVAHPHRLIEARAAFSTGFKRARQAVELGMEQTLVTTFQWQDVGVQQGHNLISVIDALDSALVGPTQIPFSQPATSLDLSSFFDGGRVLDEEIPWMIRGEDPEQPRWIRNEAANQAFFIDGVFSPTFEAGSPAPRIDLDGETPQDIGHGLVFDYTELVQDVFFTTR